MGHRYVEKKRHLPDVDIFRRHIPTPTHSMERRNPVGIGTCIILFQHVLIQIRLMRTPIRSDQRQARMVRICDVYWVFSQMRIKSSIAPLLGRPLGHGLVVRAEVIAMCVVVGPRADGGVVKGIYEDRLGFC